MTIYVGRSETSFQELLKMYRFMAKIKGYIVFPYFSVLLASP